MKKQYVYAKAGPKDCFKTFLIKNNYFVFWWNGVSAEHWLGEREVLLDEISQYSKGPQRDWGREQASCLWEAINKKEIIAFTILSTQLSWFTIERGQVFSGNNDMRKLWPKHYKESEVLKGRELVYVKIKRNQRPLAEVPNLLYSLPCNRRVASSTFCPITDLKFPQHIKLLSLLIEDQNVLEVTQEDRLLYLGPQQIETAIALALMQKGVKGISLRPHNLKTWDIIGISNGYLPKPLPQSGGLYIQVKSLLPDQKKQKRDFEMLRDQLEERNSGFLICPRVSGESKDNILGGDWLARFISGSPMATEYVEGCIGRWVSCSNCSV